MAQVGDTYTFTVAFFDGFNTPLIVPDPAIEIFSFDTNGTKVVLVQAGTEMVAVEDDVGRYAYTYQIDLAYSLAPTIFAMMSGTDPESASPIIVEEQLHLVSGSGSGGNQMVARFVKGG